MSDAQLPEGHAVRAYVAATDPGTLRTDAGLVIASLGFGGDDDARELGALVEDVVTQLRSGAPPSIRFAREAVTVPQLFAPSPLPPAVRGDRVLWTARRDALRAVLEQGGGIAAVVAAITSIEAMHLLVVDDDWSAGAAPLDALAAAGVTILQTAAGAPFLVEVKRPDGVIAALTAGPPRIAGPPTREPRQLVRSPRLERMLVDLVHDRGDLAALHEELRARTAPLLVFLHDGKLPTVTWPGKPPAILAFGDLRSLLRLARETQRPGGDTIGGMMAPALLEIAHQDRGELALVAYDGDRVHYVTI